MVPNQEHFPEIHLRVLEFTLVVESMHFGHCQAVTQRTKSVIQVGVLEGQMNTHEA